MNHGGRRGAFPPFYRVGVAASTAGLLLLLAGCATAPKVGTLNPRTGDEIVVAGQFFHTGTRVVTWMDPGGYDAYRVERRFSPIEVSSYSASRTNVPDLDSPNRYNLRGKGLSPEEIEQVRGGGWDLPLLQKTVDQFVVHYDVCGTSRQCFKVLHDLRCLSVHFMLDLDGTIYQTLDLKERAWHAGTANTRSVGIEIANMGAYRGTEKNPFQDWYASSNGTTVITIPQRFGDGGILTPNFVGKPARPEPVVGTLQGSELTQYDFTPEQYEALTRLTATLCAVFPNMKCDYPKGPDGKVIPAKLDDAELERYQGILGHWHVTTSKVDPGPAFDWEKVVGGAQRLLRNGFTPAADATSRGHLRKP
jgi:N-acetyl-anhydromuramyl-L-alanine amidase AmpD